MRYTVAAVFLVLILAFTGCVTTQQEHERLQLRVARLQDKQQELKKEYEDQLERMEAKLQDTRKQLAARIQNSTNPVQSAQANLWSEIRNLRQETAKLQGNLQTQIKRAEKQTNGTEQLDKLETRLKKLEDRVETIVSRLGLDSLEASENDTTRSEKNRTEPEEIPAEKLYEKALSSFRDREYKQAINLWDLFIKKQPESDLVPNAYFWQGECYYQLQDYSQAALKYQKVVENYPDSGKHPAALLKQGLSFYRLDKDKPGRILLQRLVDNYPDTSEAKRARKFLEKQ